MNNPTTPYTWESPWLTETGKVWIHLGYGHWELMPQNDPRAVHYLDGLRRSSAVSRRAQATRLEMFLLGLQRAK